MSTALGGPKNPLLQRAARRSVKSRALTAQRAEHAATRVDYAKSSA
jgi:hypothetical protein